MSDDPLALAASAAAGALVLVARTAGSTPRHVGACMLVEPGRTVGTIGGGRLEAEATAIARAPAPPFRRSWKTYELGMCCGGEIELVFAPVAPAAAVLAELARRRGRREPVALLVAAGGLALDGSPARQAGAARLEDDVLVLPLSPPPRLVLFGGGHVARAVAPLAAACGFAVAVCDDEAEVAAPARFPGATLVHSFDVAEAAAELGGLGRGDYAVILTRDHGLDQAVLEGLLGRDLDYLGLIGSVTKRERFRARLETRGLLAGWERLRCPVGLDIGAETPEEIAVAIVAELVSRRRRACAPPA